MLSFEYLHVEQIVFTACVNGTDMIYDVSALFTCHITDSAGRTDSNAGAASKALDLIQDETMPW